MNKAVDLDMMAGFYPTGKVDISLKKLNTMMNHCRVTLGCLVSARGCSTISKKVIRKPLNGAAPPEKGSPSFSCGNR